MKIRSTLFSVSTSINRSRLLGLLLTLFFVGHSGAVTVVNALQTEDPVGARRSLYPNEWGIAHPAGLAYAPQFGYFFLLDKARNNPAVTTLVTLTPYEQQVERVELTFRVGNALNMTYDAQGRRLLLLNQTQTEIAQVSLDEQGHLQPATLRSSSLAQLQLRNVQGMAVDPVNQRLLFLEKAKRRLVSLPLNAALDLPATAASFIDLTALGAAALRGVAVHPLTQQIFIGNPAQHALYVIDQSGALVHQYTTSALALNDPQAFVFAPSADLTDAADTIHLFVADSYQPDTQAAEDIPEAEQGAIHLYLPLITAPEVEYNSAETTDQEEQNLAPSANTAPQPGKGRLGEITEVALNWSPDRVTAAANPTIILNLVQSVNSSTFVPPSPDPSGIAFNSSRNRLLISDAEVDEMPALFTGVNLFETTLVGTLSGTGSTYPHTLEPSGAAFNPTNDHLFLADDDRHLIIEVAPGADGVTGTADDLVTSFDTTVFNSLDSEDVTYDATNGVLYIIDGVNAEVYRVSPGANGRFDGVPARGGDDVVSNFDVESNNILDPEGIYYDKVSDHLFVTGNNNDFIYELTTTGAFVQLYDMSAANSWKNAGITMAPGSANPNVMNFYIVDRGIDNDIDPTENDGKLHELTRPTVTPTPTPLPPGEAVMVGAGDIASCAGNGDNATATLLDGIGGTVFTVGDNVYEDGAPGRFENCYGPTWGRHKERTKPAAGNHEYDFAGAADYFAYFGAAAGDPSKGYYSYDLAAWHIIVLNSNCTEVGGCQAGSLQEQWLRADLAAHPTACTLAYFHHPRFSSGATHGSSAQMQPFWQALYDYGADVVLVGHDHHYERFARQDPAGVAAPTRGIRQFLVGMGGFTLYPLGTPLPNSEVRNNDTWGVLKLALHPTGYDWQFIPVAGKTFTDTGSESCVQLAPVATATPIMTPTNTPLPAPTNTPIPTATNTPLPAPTNTATATAVPPTATATPAGSACQVTYLITSRWNNGFTADVTIKNNSATTINGWNLTWSFAGNQFITNLWNGVLTQTGQNVRVRNLSYNNLISANGGTQTFGFQAFFSGSNSNPQSFALNGSLCNQSSATATPVPPTATPVPTATSTPTVVAACPRGGFLLDQFNTVNYNNNNGTVAWKSAWSESFDNNAPSSGRIRITSNELRLSDSPDSGQIPALARQANLTGAATAVLGFDYRTSLTVDSTDQVRVQISSNGGSTWTTVRTFSGKSSGTVSIDISAYRSANVLLRFQVSANYNISDEYFAVDNVRISCN